MGQLSTKARKDLPKSQFALPEERRFPVEDAAHARNAKARATQAVKAGRLSKADKTKVDRKADAVTDKA